MNPPDPACDSAFKPGSRSSPAVQAVGLTKRFGAFTAVDGISFSVERGTIFGFLGPNGAGKTTTIRILLGLLKPSSGQAIVLGCDAARQARQVRKRIGYISQRFSLYEDMTVDENLAFFGRTYGVRGRALRERKASVLDLVGMRGRERTLVRHLAGGWKQRLALAAAITHAPEILFLDEPTAGVDPISRRHFWGLLYGLAEGGTTVLVTTHYMDEAEHCQMLAFLQGGRIVALGAPGDLKATEMRGQVIEVDCSDPARAMALLRSQGGFDEVALYGTLIHAVAPGAATRSAEVRHLLECQGIQIRTIEPISPSLEDVFISSLRSPSAGSKEGTGDAR